MTTPTHAAEDTVENFLARITEAWNAAAAAAYAREFREDATYVIYLGDALLGRAEIERTHVDVLTRWQRGTKMIVEPVAVTILGKQDVATVLTIGGLGPAETAEVAEYDKFQTFTLVRRDGRWRCAAFQNTEMSDHAKHRHNDPVTVAGQ